MNNLVLVTLVLAGSVIAQNQSKKMQTTPTTGTIEGRVFLITAGGDIKPARFAKLFFLNRMDRGSAEKAELSAGDVWLSESTLNYRAYEEEYNRSGFGEEYNHCPVIPNNSLELYVCKRGLSIYDEALTVVLNWSKGDTKKGRQILGAG